MTRPARERLDGILLIALSAVGFGVMAIFTRLAYAHGADLYGVLIPRFWIAGLILLMVALLRGLAWPKLATVALLAAMGGIGYVGQSYCFFSALNYAPASLVALLLYTYPIMVTLLAALFLHERITMFKLSALALCGLGTLLTIGANGIGVGATTLGVSLALGAAVIYAVYVTVGAKITRDVDPVVTTTVVCLAAAVVLTLLALARSQMGMPPHFPVTATGWAGVAGVTIISTVIAILAFFAGLQRLGASLASMLSTLEPIVTVGLAALLLSESLTAWQWLGGTLTLVGVVRLAGASPVPEPACHGGHTKATPEPTPEPVSGAGCDSEASQLSLTPQIEGWADL